MDKNSMNNNHWSTYWQSGVLTSLPMDFKQNYDGELADFWRGIMAQNQGHTRILDLCTGNGAVAILLQELATELEQSVSITAVDASVIHPSMVARQFPEKGPIIERIEFIGQCPVEQMTEQLTGPFDLIVSQYGIEYCDTAGAAQAIQALLLPKGRLVFVSHAPETDIHQYMRHEERIYQLLEDLGVFGLMMNFHQDRISANGFKNKLSQLLPTMHNDPTNRSKDLFMTWLGALTQLSQMNNNQLKEQKPRMGQFTQQYLDARARAADMLAVSDKLTENPQWYLSFAEHGLELIDHGPILYQGKHHAGDQFQFKVGSKSLDQ